MTYRYPVVVVREKRECWAYVPVLPGVYGLGRTAAAAKADLKRAIELYIEDCREDGERVPRFASEIVEVDQLAIAV